MGDFVIKYDVSRAQDLGDIQIVYGYFVHFFAPADLPRLPKNVVFVIDRSGSMRGTKMQQTREALLTILSDLYQEDHFALIVFEGDINTWRPSLSKAMEENVKAAKEYAKTIKDEGYYLITKKSLDSTLFCLGFGYDLDYNFLDVMAKQNDGLARRIYEASDAVLQLQGFYDEVASPLLSEVHFKYPENTVNSLTSSHFKQLFNGSEIVVAGRLNDIEMNDFPVEVSAQGGENDFMVQGQASAQKWDTIFPDQDYIFGDFTERLWAYLTIQQLLEKKDKGTPEEKANATAEALELSLKYNFVTPLTSMVVTKPETEDKPEDTMIAEKLTEGMKKVPVLILTFKAPLIFNFLSETAIKHNHKTPEQDHQTIFLTVDGDPDFIIELPNKNDALCFNIKDKPGTIFNLVKDPLTGTIVNGQTIGDKKVDPANKGSTYFGRFGIIHEKFGIRLMISTQEILVSQHGKQAKLLWSDSSSIKGLNMDLLVTKDRSLTVTLKNSVKFVIILHKVWKKHPYHQDYLGFYTLDSHLFSQKVHGLLGQFYNGVQFEVSDLFPGKDVDKPDAFMFIKGHRLVVTRGWQKDYRKDVKDGENVPCWFVHDNGTGLIDGDIRDYIVPGLFKTN
ncbi:hypothetical protein NFI96_031477 [Prochilodus magdalenae]|nr:hypothetical protein NFI96_031477 [Prochilodus magdalenae]